MAEPIRPPWQTRSETDKTNPSNDKQPKTDSETTESSPHFGKVTLN